MLEIRGPPSLLGHINVEVLKHLHVVVICSTKISDPVKTGPSRLGPHEGGKCDSIGLSAVCPSKEATICSVVVAVV